MPAGLADGERQRRMLFLTRRLPAWLDGTPHRGQTNAAGGNGHPDVGMPHNDFCAGRGLIRRPAKTSGLCRRGGSYDQNQSITGQQDRVYPSHGGVGHRAGKFVEISLLDGKKRRFLFFTGLCVFSLPLGPAHHHCRNVVGQTNQKRSGICLCRGAPSCQNCRDFWSAVRLF